MSLSFRKIRLILIVILNMFWLTTASSALQPKQILVIANSDIPESIDIAQYYCDQREVPFENIFTLSLGSKLTDDINRIQYEKQIAQPLRKKLRSPEYAEKIKCLITTYGLPYRIGKRGPLTGWQKQVRRLQNLYANGEKLLEEIEDEDSSQASEKRKRLKIKLAQIEQEIDRLVGNETGASLDSELSLILNEDYELYRWQNNPLKNPDPPANTNVLMVSRLDAPSPAIAKALIDKATTAEALWLKGNVYIDARGKPDDKKPLSFGAYDQSLRDMAKIFRKKTPMVVIEENTPDLFQPGDCQKTAIYCGWYSLKEYIDAFDFINGAVGYHISSWEAVNLRDPDSDQWVPAMLTDGITATIGAVAEPYLSAFPKPDEFFSKLLDGDCLVEAFYRTKKYNSWQLLLIGDPLYQPFNSSNQPLK